MRGERHGAREGDIVQVTAVVQSRWRPSTQQSLSVQQSLLLVHCSVSECVEENNRKYLHFFFLGLGSSSYGCVGSQEIKTEDVDLPQSQAQSLGLA